MARPPIDPARTYTILTDVVARRRLDTEFGVPRHESGAYTLDELHDALAERLPQGFAGHFLVVTERGFQRITARSDELLRRFHTTPFDPQAGLSSWSGAVRAISDAGAEVPEGAQLEDLEDALTGLRGTSQIIISDADFDEYGREMTAILQKQPSGRSPH